MKVIMSDAEWDAEAFEPVKATVIGATDRWEGEDEDEEIKDNWDDEEEEKKENVTKKPEGTKRKTLKVRFAENEVKGKAELEKTQDVMKPEELPAEKARARKLADDAVLEVAKDAGEEPRSNIDSFTPNSRAEFLKFGDVLKDKIRKFEKSPHYTAFLETLFRDLSANLQSEEVKKLGSQLNVISNEKAKVAKAANKGKKKKKAGAKLNAGRNDDYSEHTVTAEYEEYDDYV